MTTPKKKKPATPKEAKAAAIAEAGMKTAFALSTPAKAAPKKKATARNSTPKKPIVVGLLWCVVTFVIGSIGGVFVAKGIKIDAGQQDVLSDAYRADRISQVAILRELAQQPFDGSTSEGLEAGVKWFNANRFRDRPTIFEPYSDAVAEAIQQNAEDELASQLEPKK